MIGYVFVYDAPGKENEILEKLEALDKVREAHPLFGEIDQIVQVVDKDYDSMISYINKNIRQMNGVIDIKTLILAEEMAKELEKQGLYKMITLDS